MKLALLAVAKVVIPVGLLLLGVNGLVDVQLQKDMNHKSTQLQRNVSEAKSLSGQLGQGLTGLGPLQQTTEHMQASLQNIEQSSLAMATGLATLAQTVSGINQSVLTTHSGVAQSQSAIQSISQSEMHILSTLQNLNQVNSDVVSNLGVMLSDEESMRQDLAQMNQKTALVP